MPRVNPSAYDLANADPAAVIRTHIDSLVVAIEDIDANGTVAGVTTATIQTTAGGAGVAQPLPSAPAGYISVVIGGDVRVIPYFNAT